MSRPESKSISKWQSILSALADARDAKIGAVGAGQVRQLYNEGKSNEAQDLAKRYFTANVVGTALGLGAAAPFTASPLTREVAKAVGKNLLKGTFDYMLADGITRAVTGKDIMTNVNDTVKGVFGDNKYTNFATNYVTPFLPIPVFGTGKFGETTMAVGRNIYNKASDVVNKIGNAITDTADNYIINRAFKNGKLYFGIPTIFENAYHQSSKPITRFKFPFKERWDVINHRADPNAAFFTLDKPADGGFLSRRPFTSEFTIYSQRPLYQVGEIKGITKNSIRNKIVERARKQGADAIVFDGIADNQLKDQRILMALDKANISHVRTTLGTPKSKILQYIKNNNEGLLNDLELLDQILTVEKSGFKPKGSYYEPILEQRFDIPMDFEFIMQTPRFKEKYPAGITMFARGIDRGVMTRVPHLKAIFGGNLPLAGGYYDSFQTSSNYKFPIVSKINGNNIYSFRNKDLRVFKGQKDGTTLGIFVIPKIKPKIIDVKNRYWNNIGYNGFETTDDLAYEIGLGRQPSHILRNILDAGLGMGIKGQRNIELIYGTKFGYPKSIYNTSGTFDLADPDPFKKNGGKIKTKQAE